MNSQQLLLYSGVDLVEISRIARLVQQYGNRFLQRIYTPNELSEVGTTNYPSLATRYAAKEALSKALGTGIGDVSWQEIEILRNRAKQPQIYLSGNAQLIAERLGIQTWTISLSHTQEHAIALVVGAGMHTST